jgi:hypothetical protein
VRQTYLTACLLVFYQQLRLYLDREREYRPFLVERSLWVFVGGSMNAVHARAGLLDAQGRRGRDRPAHGRQRRLWGHQRW